MSIPGPQSQPAAPAATPEKFETLLGRLEQIVSDMEGAELPLEKLLSSYEEGMRLVKACGDRLADAEQKVEILSRGVPGAAASAAPTGGSPHPGGAVVSPSISAPLAGAGDTALTPTPDAEDDDIRLI